MAEETEKPKGTNYLIYIVGFLISFLLTFGAMYWYVVKHRYPPSPSEVQVEQPEEMSPDSSAVTEPDVGKFAVDSEQTELREVEEVEPSVTTVQEKPQSKDGVKQLAEIYGEMRAEEAAAIIARLNDTDVVQILINMRGREAAKILTAMEPERAAKISRRMVAFR